MGNTGNSNRLSWLIEVSVRHIITRDLACSDLQKAGCFSEGFAVDRLGITWSFALADIISNDFEDSPIDPRAAQALIVVSIDVAPQFALEFSIVSSATLTYLLCKLRDW